MKFSRRQIEMALQFKQLGLPWEPSVGHYVYDSTGSVKPSSPFQRRVYFLLNYDCFMERVGGVERFKELMTWLPTWDDARNILRSLGVTDAEVNRELLASQAIKYGIELYTLYEMIQAQLRERKQHVKHDHPVLLSHC